MDGSGASASNLNFARMQYGPELWFFSWGCMLIGGEYCGNNGIAPINPNYGLVIEQGLEYQKEKNIVRLSVYDMLGREVAVLVNQDQPSGYYSAPWSAGGFSSGAYVYCISVKDASGSIRFSGTKWMMLVK